jgi:IS1 family transposase
MKRQALIKKKNLENGIKISEAVVYDGFETFTYSQFDPCYVNTAIGKKSLYTYEINYSPLNRKGRMTHEQKIKNEKLCARYGRYPSAAIQTQTTYTIKKLIKSCPHQSLQLYTDEHQSYQRSLQKDLLNFKIDHFLTNSRVSRNGKNPLFAVNHLHLWYRHFLSAQKRETIAFNKNEAGLMDTIFLQTICKNYLSPQMYKRTPYNKLRNSQSPAMAIGLTSKILTFEEFFDCRRMASQVDFDVEERQFYYSEYLFQRRKICQFSGP